MANNLASRLTELDAASIPGCSVSKIIAELDDETAQLLNRVLDGAASTRSIWDALRNEGYKIDRTTLQMHRNGRCICGKEIES